MRSFTGIGGFILMKIAIILAVAVMGSSAFANASGGGELVISCQLPDGTSSVLTADSVDVSNNELSVKRYDPASKRFVTKTKILRPNCAIEVDGDLNRNNP
jgi:hypothetical protein